MAEVLSDAAMIGQMLDHAEQYGFRMFSDRPSLKIYTVDVRGTVTHDKRNCSIEIDFHDLAVTHFDGHQIKYCEGNSNTLQHHLKMNDDSDLLNTWASNEAMKG